MQKEFVVKIHYLFEWRLVLSYLLKYNYRWNLEDDNIHEDYFNFERKNIIIVRINKCILWGYLSDLGDIQKNILVYTVSEFVKKIGGLIADNGKKTSKVRRIIICGRT